MITRRGRGSPGARRESRGNKGNSMEIKDQSGLRAVLADIPVPRMALIRQIFPDDGIKNIGEVLRRKLEQPALRNRVKPGMRVVLTGSSRRIANMPAILRELAAFVASGSGGLWNHPGSLRLPHRLLHEDRADWRIGKR